MPEELTPEEVGLLIQARKLINSKGLPRNIDVSGICERAGISRKTGYQWAEKLEQQKTREEQQAEELARLKTAHEKLKKDFEDVSFENRGRKLAWEIHRVDEFLKKKKDATTRGKKKRKR
jgi:transposase